MTGGNAGLILAMAVTLFAAWRVVSTARIMHAALWLGLTFLGVATVFLMLNADFVAAAQVLVYVGAISTMIVFGIMLSGRSELRGTHLTRLRVGKSGIWPLAVAGGFGAVMFHIYRQVRWPPAPPADLVPRDTTALIGEQLFTHYVVPFELVSLLLLVALLGAIVLSTQEPQPAAPSTGKGDEPECRT